MLYTLNLGISLAPQNNATVYIAIYNFIAWYTVKSTDYFPNLHSSPKGCTQALNRIQIDLAAT